jgi:hypothetical protein
MKFRSDVCKTINFVVIEVLLYTSGETRKAKDISALVHILEPKGREATEG